MKIKVGDIFEITKSFGPTVIKTVRGWIKSVEDRGKYWYIGYESDPTGEYWCGFGYDRIYKDTGRPKNHTEDTFKIVGFRARRREWPTNCGFMFRHPSFDIMHDPKRR
jgi:hypothetical protein